MVQAEGKMQHHALEAWQNLSDEEKKAIEQRRQSLRLLLGKEYTPEIRSGSEAMGTVKPQIDPQKLLSRVLQRARRQQGEISFALDAEGKIHTADPADIAKLSQLPLVQVCQSNGKDQSIQSVMRNWILVTHQDPESGLYLGIARPIQETVTEIRRTALRNLLYGMGVIGLAMIGTLPLSGGLTKNLRSLSRYLEELGKGNLKIQAPVPSHDEIGRLARTFNRMAVQLEENQRILVNQERLRKELELCRTLQEEFLPRSSLKQGMAEIRGKLRVHFFEF
jgi:HAMP domain-containing protein